MLGIIEKIDGKFTRNNIFLEQAKYSGSKDSTCYKSYIKCGAPFFKDALGTSAPFNEDYKLRRKCHEFFPFDLPETRSRWKTKEKVALITGIKEQMISHIKSQQSRNLCGATRQTRGKFQKLKFISKSLDLQNSSMVDIYESVQKDYQDFTINWNLISFSSLQSNHSVPECMGMWFSYLRPDINREPFTDEENQRLANILVNNDFNSWEDIAAQLDRRTSLQTFVYFHANFGRYYPSHIRWTKDEDAKLLQSIEKHSVNNVINWSKVGQILPTRNKSQCYNRYQVLVKSQSLKKGVFDLKENRTILEYVKAHGENALKQMPKNILPGRSLLQVKSHYNHALKHKGTVHPWTREEDKKLVDFVSKDGTNNWRGIAEILKTHSRVSCRTRYFTISKFLANNKDKTIADVPSKHKKKTGVQKAAEENQSEDEDIEMLENDSASNEIKDNKTRAIEKFKKQQPKMFKLMSTTFSYDLSAREISTDNTKLLVLMCLLKFEEKALSTRRPYLFTPNQLDKLREIAQLELNDTLLNEVRFVTTHTQFLLPPNYNTTVGLRAIEIKMQDETFDKDSVTTSTQPNSAYSEALENFQKLFFSLFYWSAMLKKVDIDKLNEIHFMKYPKKGMSASDIFNQLSQRRLPLAAGFSLKSSSGSEKYPRCKRRKT